jgi:hypothetical protein
MPAPGCDYTGMSATLLQGWPLNREMDTPKKHPWWNRLRISLGAFLALVGHY